MAVTGLVYTGTKVITGVGGPVTVLEFTAAGATLTTFSLKSPCLDAFQWVQSAPSAAMVNVTIEATAFEATVAATTVTFTPATPPTAALLPGGTGTLTSVAIQGPQLGAASLISVLTSHVAAC